MYARAHGLIPLGTMAHEYLQACQALGTCACAIRRRRFETWATRVPPDLGIALSTVTGWMHSCAISILLLQALRWCAHDRAIDPVGRTADRPYSPTGSSSNQDAGVFPTG